MLLLIATVSNLYSQTLERQQEFKSFEEAKHAMELIFSGIERERVPYGILLDKAVAMGDITLYDGLLERGIKETRVIARVFTLYASAK